MEHDAINRRFRAVDKREPISRISGWLRGDSREVPIVMDGKKPYGIVDARQLSSRGVHATTRIDRVALPVPILHADDSNEDVLHHFSQTLAPYLPIQDSRHRPIGTVSSNDALAWLDDGPSAAASYEPVPALQVTDSIDDAIHAFAKTHADHLPVLEHGKVAGVVARSAIMRVQAVTDQPDGSLDWGGESVDVRNQPISGYMDQGWSESPVATSFNRTRAAVRLANYSFVTDHGKYVGIATAPQMARAAEKKAQR